MTYAYSILITISGTLVFPNHIMLATVVLASPIYTVLVALD